MSPNVSFIFGFLFVLVNLNYGYWQTTPFDYFIGILDLNFFLARYLSVQNANNHLDKHTTFESIQTIYYLLD